MKERINFWSFIFSFICLALLCLSFLLNTSTIAFVHPFEILLFFSMGTFVSGIIGMTGVKNWKSLIMSIVTFIITAFLSLFIIVIVFFGHLYQGI